MGTKPSDLTLLSLQVLLLLLLPKPNINNAVEWARTRKAKKKNGKIKSKIRIHDDIDADVVPNKQSNNCKHLQHFWHREQKWKISANENNREEANKQRENARNQTEMIMEILCVGNRKRTTFARFEYMGLRVIFLQTTTTPIHSIHNVRHRQHQHKQHVRFAMITRSFPFARARMKFLLRLTGVVVLCA